MSRNNWAKTWRDQWSGVSIKVTGLDETLRALLQAGADAADMKDLMHHLGMIVATDAQARAPIGKTGRLAASIRAGRGKTKAVIRAGSARVPYVPVPHYGWPARHVRTNPFMLEALLATRTQVISELHKGINQLLKQNHLK